MITFALVILSLGLVVVLCYSTALPIRHLIRNFRDTQIGELMWYQIKPESLISGRARRTPEEQVVSVASFMNGLQESWWRFARRGVASIVWQMGEDDLLRLYIGIDKAHHDSMKGGLDALASGMNCRAEYGDAPAIPSRNPSFAFREIGTPANILKDPESLGNVARDLSHIGIRGSVIFTLEDMSPSESRRTEKFIAGQGVSSDSGYMFSGAQSNIVGATAIRSCIAAVASNGDYKSSESLLKQAYGSIGTSAVKITTHSPFTRYTLQGIVGPIIYSLVVGLFMMIGFPVYLGIMFIVPAALLALANGAGLPIAGRSWVEQRIAKGEIVIPPYRSMNTRALRNRISTMLGFTGYRAPSRGQVIPLYGAPLAQIMSFPDGDATLNIASEVVPQIGVPSTMDLTQRDDYVFFGTTGAGQPIGILYSDLEHSLYIAGAPNSGKSNLLELAYGQVARMTPENCGLKITPLWVETKGSGSYDAWEASKVNPRSIFIDAHNPSSNFRLALEGPRLSEGASVREVLSNVNSMVSGLQFAYGDAIADSSREALDFSIRIAMLLNQEEIEYLEVSREVNPAKPNVIRLASLIIKEDGYYKIGPKLLQMREEMLKKSDKSPLDEREDALSHSIGVLNAYFSDRKDMTSKSAPPSNKLSALGNLETLWTPDHRTDVYVTQIPAHFAPIVLNMGPYIIGQDVDNQPIYSSTSQTDARMALLAFNHMLWKFAQARCSGWQEQGKRVILFSDEMKDIAVDTDNSDADNVVASISKEGRSRGFSIWCASQAPHQVPISVQSELFGFRTKIWFALPNKESARMVVNQMPRDTYFAEENIQKLPIGLAVVGEIRQGNMYSAPFTLIVPIAKRWLEYYDHSGLAVSVAFRNYAEREFTSVSNAISTAQPLIE